VFGAREAAWPLIRDDLDLSYVEVGILISAPLVLNTLVEPILGVLADIGKRRALILGGGVLFAVELALTAASSTFVMLLAVLVLFTAASSAFVGLSQTILMDLQPARREHNMARWTFAGSLGTFLGPLALAAALGLGAGWRGLFLGFSLLAAALVAMAWRLPPGPIAAASSGDPHPTAFGSGALSALRALRRGEVLRWLVLIELADSMLDVLLGFLALYFVDVVGETAEGAALAVAVWSGVGLVGDFLLIPILARVPGLVYLRAAVVAELVLFPAFLVAPWIGAKLVLLGLLGFFNSGWYAILVAQLYAALPGRSGTAVAVSSVSDAVGGVIPLVIGAVAQRFGLQTAMWLLLAGPIGLLLGLVGGQGSGVRGRRPEDLGHGQ